MEEAARNATDSELAGVPIFHSAALNVRLARYRPLFRVELSRESMFYPSEFRSLKAPVYQYNVQVQCRSVSDHFRPSVTEEDVKKVPERREKE